MYELGKTFLGKSLVIAIAMALLLPGVAYAVKPVSISTPISGEVVSGVYVVSGTGSGAATEVAVDGGAWQATSGGKNWTYSWDTSAYSDGPHTMVAQYTDGSSTDSVNVTVSNGSAGPRQPVSGEVLINEFVAANGTIQTSEWVELYNTASETLDIGGMWIDDIDAGGGAPKQIPAGTSIDAGSYYVMTFSSFLE